MAKPNFSLFLKRVWLLLTLLVISRQCPVYLTEMLAHFLFLSGTSAAAVLWAVSKISGAVNKTQISKFSSVNSLGWEKHASCLFSTEPTSLRASEHCPLPCPSHQLDLLRKLRVTPSLGFLGLNLKILFLQFFLKSYYNVPFQLQMSNLITSGDPFYLKDKGPPKAKRLLIVNNPRSFCRRIFRPAVFSGLLL